MSYTIPEDTIARSQSKNTSIWLKCDILHCGRFITSLLFFLSYKNDMFCAIWWASIVYRFADLKKEKGIQSTLKRCSTKPLTNSNRFHIIIKMVDTLRSILHHFTWKLLRMTKSDNKVSTLGCVRKTFPGPNFSLVRVMIRSGANMPQKKFWPRRSIFS